MTRVHVSFWLTTNDARSVAELADDLERKIAPADPVDAANPANWLVLPPYRVDEFAVAHESEVSL